MDKAINHWESFLVSEYRVFPFPYINSLPQLSRLRIMYYFQNKHDKVRTIVCYSNGMNYSQYKLNITWLSKRLNLYMRVLSSGGRTWPNPRLSCIILRQSPHYYTQLRLISLIPPFSVSLLEHLQ